MEITKAKVAVLIGCSERQVDRIRKQDSSFPRSLKAGLRLLVWKEDEIIRWRQVD